MRYGLVRLIARRFAVGAATLLALSLLVFCATQALPGDAAVLVLGPNATDTQVNELRDRLGLNQPIAIQYAHWLSGVVRGNLGTSLANDEAVIDVIEPRISASAVLVCLSALIAVPIALLIGIWSAVKRDALVDLGLSGALLIIASLPEFVVAIGLIMLLATTVFQFFPPVSLIDPETPVMDQLEYLVLPVITLVLASVPYVARMMRASMIEVLDSQYIVMARLNGIPERSVIGRHAFRNAIAPAIQVIALTLTYLAGGVVVVEAVFNYPGIGTALIDAVRYRDLPTVQFLTLLIGSIYVLTNLIADVCVILVTPKLRTTL